MLQWLFNFQIVLLAISLNIFFISKRSWFIMQGESFNFIVPSNQCAITNFCCSFGFECGPTTFIPSSTCGGTVPPIGRTASFRGPIFTRRSTYSWPTCFASSFCSSGFIFAIRSLWSNCTTIFSVWSLWSSALCGTCASFNRRTSCCSADYSSSSYWPLLLHSSTSDIFDWKTCLIHTISIQKVTFLTILNTCLCYDIYLSFWAFSFLLSV